MAPPYRRPPQQRMADALTSMLVGMAMMVAFIYLINPSLGVFELLPDNLPLVGNLDEGAATALLVGGLRYFGIDLLGVFGGPVRRRRLPPRTVEHRDPADRA